MFTSDLTVRGPWWGATADQRYAFGLALVTFAEEKELTVYAYTEVTDEKPFTEEAAAELQERFERQLGKTMVRGA